LQVTDFAAVVREAMREEVSKFHEMELEAHGSDHDHDHDHGHRHHGGHAGAGAGQSVWAEEEEDVGGSQHGQSAARGWHDQHEHGYSPSGLVVDEVHEEIHLQIDSLEHERKVCFRPATFPPPSFPLGPL
jgi:hypothetical protein